MRLQVAWNFKKSRTELQVTLQRNELLDLTAAEMTRGVRGGLLLPVDFDHQLVQSKKLVLRYDITGLTPLKKRLRHLWTYGSYYTMLQGIERVLVDCAAWTQPVERTQFDLEHIYMSEQDEPHFIYVPVAGAVYDTSKNSPRLVLDALSDTRHLRFDAAESVAVATELHQYVMTNEVFSLNHYRRFLDAQFAAQRGLVAAPASAASEPAVDEHIEALFASFDRNLHGRYPSGRGAQNEPPKQVWR